MRSKDWHTVDTEQPQVPRIPRYLPAVPLPPYTYRPGISPHPTRDPGGHSYGAASPPVAAPDPSRWSTCDRYLYGIDLFNHGYYWEAHEAWESLWHACGRSGVTADFLRALIRLAAAGFKARQGRPEGVRRHAEAAGELFRSVGERSAGGHRRTMGLVPDALCAVAARVADGRGLLGRPADAPGDGPVFSFRLLPRDRSPDDDSHG